MVTCPINTNELLELSITVYDFCKCKLYPSMDGFSISASPDWKHLLSVTKLFCHFFKRAVLASLFLYLEIVCSC